MIDLKAVLRLDDRLSNQLRSVDRAISTTARNSGRLSKALGDVGKSGSGMNSVTSSIGKVTLALGGALSAAKLFQSTIGEAMKFEQQQVLVNAVFDNSKLSKQYTDMLQRVAQKSPLLDSAAMMANSSGLVSITKDVGQLEKAWGIVERLNVVNPSQNIDGAIMALKELQSGDVVSLSERFNISKKELNNLKKLSFKEQLEGLDKYLNKTGITTKAVDAMGNTSLGRINQIKERLSSVFRNIGTNGNTGIGKALDGVLAKINSPAFDKFAQTMNVKIGGAITYATDKAIKFASYVQNNWGTISNVAKGVAIAFVGLKALSFLVGLFSTIATVVGGGIKVFRALWKIVGFVRKAFTLVRLAMMLFPGSWIVLAITGVITAGVLLYRNFDKVKAVAKNLWARLKEVRSVKDLVALAFDVIKSAAEKSINFVIGKINDLIGVINKVPGVNVPIIAKVDWSNATAPAKKLAKSNPQLSSLVNYAPKNYGGLNLPGHKGGLDRVPYDGYIARLHEGERVQTRDEANAARNGSGGNVFNFGDIILQGSGYTKKDAEQIMEYIVNATFRAANAGA